MHRISEFLACVYILLLLGGCSTSQPSDSARRERVTIEDLQTTGFDSKGYERYDVSHYPYSIQVPVGFKPSTHGFGVNIEPSDDHYGTLQINFAKPGDKPYKLQDLAHDVQVSVGSYHKAHVSDKTETVNGQQYTFDKVIYTCEPEVGWQPPPDSGKGFVMVSNDGMISAEARANWPIAPDLLRVYEKIVLSTARRAGE